MLLRDECDRVATYDCILDTFRASIEARNVGVDAKLAQTRQHLRQGPFGAAGSEPVDHVKDAESVHSPDRFHEQSTEYPRAPAVRQCWTMNCISTSSKLDRLLGWCSAIGLRPTAVPRNASRPRRTGSTSVNSCS